MTEPSGVHATVVVLTFNAAEWIAKVLEGCLRQRAAFGYEVLVIDSGSRDETLDIVRRFPSVRLHEIPNTDFGHGRTRNLAAQLARGDIVVFLTHDAIPAHDLWLTEMVRPFSIDDRVACVYGKHIPWRECPPTIKRDVINTFRGLGPEYALTLQEANPLVTHIAQLDAMTFFSDVNSAIRKSILIGSIPFRDLDYAEDQRFARDAIAAGYIKVYTPFGAVIHSHNYSLLKYFRRMYDEMIGVRRATGRTLDTSLAFHVAWIGKSTIEDWVFTLRDQSYSRTEKIKWIAQAPFYNLGRRVAIRMSTRERLPAWVHQLSSLELRQKRSAQRAPAGGQAASSAQ